MMKKSKKKPLVKINRYLNTMIILTIMMPVLCYVYMMMRAGIMTTPLQTLLETYPDLAVIFLMAMIHPYMAYLLINIKKRLQNHQYQGILIELGIFMVAEIMMNNYVYLILLAVIFYQINKYLGFSLKGDIHVWLKEFRLKQNGGSLLVMMMSCLCLFATLRLK